MTRRLPMLLTLLALLLPTYRVHANTRAPVASKAKVSTIKKASVTPLQRRLQAGETVRLVGLAKVSSAVDRGQITNGIGVKATAFEIASTRGVYTITQYQQRSGLLGKLPGMRWKKQVSLSAELLDDSGTLILRSATTLENMKAIQEATSGGASVHSIAQSLRLELAGANRYALEAKTEVGLSHPSVGNLSATTLQVGELTLE